MTCDLFEKILNLFVDCQSRGKSLQINIDEDLLKILPFPRKLIFDLLHDQPISTFCQLSNDQNTLYLQNNLRLCATDQNQGGSCHSSLCEQLHMCKNYLLNNDCSEFQLLGKCSHSHSLSTNHNKYILNKYNFSSTDEHTFQLISRLIQLSLSNSSKIIVQTINGENLTDHLIDQWLDQHKSLLKNQKLINSKTVELTFDDDEVASMMQDFLIQHHSKTALIKKNLSSDLIEKDLDKEVELTNGQLNKTSIERSTFGRGRGRSQINNVPLLNNQSTQNTFSRRLASNLTGNEKKFTFSQRLNTITNENSSSQIKTKSPEIKNDDTNSFSSDFLPKVEEKQTNSSPLNDNKEMISPQNLNSKTRFVLRGHSTKIKEKSPNQTLITYNYNKPFLDEHLCYLLGPGRRNIIEKDQCQILSCLPEGYCRVRNNEQGKDIEKQLYSILPETLNIGVVKIDDYLSLIICSSAAEEIFQQNQIHYAIVSEPVKVQLNIEVIHAPAPIEHKRSSAISNASSSIDEKNIRQSPSDSQFHINSTDSTIDVISGDISQIAIDLMICVSTSNNLRESVLRRAGPKIESQYKDRHHSGDALLLEGGLTAARRILFVPWQTEIEETETIKTQKSLSDLVKWCIDQAHERKATSISFPPIGTGQLGLDPAFVCEAMISAASERLHQYKMDVLFVIYPSSGISDEDQDECYQVFRIYLDSLCEQIKSIKMPTPTMNNDRKISKNCEMRKESIRRDVQSKRILALSDSSKVIQDHHLLIKSLEDLMYEKTFDLSLIETSLIDQIDLLIDICLKCNVYPRIDYSREELTLRGDRDSCFQCFFNLRQVKKVYQYSYVLTQNGEKSDEKIINSFISLKIDEAFAVEESNICVKDDDQSSFNIDLNKLQVRLNKDKQSAFLVKKQLNVDGKIGIPPSWSSSLLMICTVEIKKSLFQSLECFQAFQETMSISDWQIERIDSIENYPLYIHFINKNKKEKTKLYFHGCSYSSVQSIIHYGLHSTNASNYGDQYDHSSICLTRDVLNSHLYGSRRSTDGKHYIFAVQIAKNDINNDLILLSNDETHLALPTYLIVYKRLKNFH